MIALIAPFSIFFGGIEEFFSLCRILFHNRSIANLAFEEVFKFAPIRLFAIEREWVFTLSLEHRIVSPQVPVSTFNCSLFFGLRFTHTGFKTVVDTRGISDDKRRTRISLSFAHSLKALSLVGTHSYLCNIYIAISSSNHTKVFFTNTFSGSGEFSNSTDRGSFRSLTTGIRIYFRIENEDIYILTGSDDMVETTITDIIRGTITTDNPLRTFYEVVTEFSNLLAYIAITLFNFRENSICQSTRLFGIIFFLDPLFKELFQLIGAARARLSFSHQFHEAGTHFFISDSHTEAKFAEIFEEGVCPSRTLTFFVNCIRSRRH